MKALVVSNTTFDLWKHTGFMSYPGTPLRQLLIPELGLKVTPFWGEVFISPYEEGDRLHPWASPYEIDLDADAIQALQDLTDAKRRLEYVFGDEGSEIAEHFAEWFNMHKPKEPVD